MTYAPAPLKALGAYLVAHGAVNLGIVGDTRHAAKGTSYHLGADKLAPGAYSATLARDRAGLTDAASAIDIGRVDGTLTGLRTLSAWLVAECQRGAWPDVREVIYSLEGKVVRRWESLDNQVRSGPGQGDNSHLTHTHLSFYRDSESRDKVALFRAYFEGEGTMPLPITEAAPKLVDLAIGAQLYRLDGTTPLVTLSSGGTGLWSPFASGSNRAVQISTGGLVQLALVRAADCANVRDLPTDAKVAFNEGVEAASTAARSARKP